jgi:hypothetical protein
MPAVMDVQPVLDVKLIEGHMAELDEGEDNLRNIVFFMRQQFLLCCLPKRPTGAVSDSRK